MRKKNIFLGGIVLSLLAMPKIVGAHCPLCTIGAGAAAGVASLLGVQPGAIGIFIGAFGVALGLWIARLIKKRYLPHQNTLLGIASWLLTVLPLRPLFQENTSFYISLAGDYGSWLNRTYVLETFFLGSLIGAAMVIVSPYLSRQLKNARKGKQFPYQGIILTFVLLLVTAFLMQWIF